jgi:hypothetical protein
MSEARFNKAVEIVQGLPKEGPIQPSLDEKLLVRFNFSTKHYLLNVHEQFYKYYKQGLSYYGLTRECG